MKWKRTASAVLTALVLVAVLAASTVPLMADGSWQIVTVDSAGYVGQFTSLALDASGRPRISYCDNTNYHLKYASWNGTSWHTETVDNDGDVGSFSSLALDASGRPRISYWDYTNHTLKYASWNGASWDIEMIDSAGYVGQFTSLALDSSGNPRISYCDGTNGALKYASWNGTSWHTETVDSAGDVGEYTSLALDSSGSPRISYYDFTNSDLKYASWNGASWQIVTVDSAGDVGRFTSLALGSSGRPRISYLDYTNGDLKYASWNGAFWDIVTVDSAGEYGGYTSLVLDSSGNPRISYCDGTNGDLKYAYLTPTSSTWYLAEGTSDYGFETYVTIENPNTSAVTAMVTYMTKSGPQTRAAIALPAMSQTVINPRNDIGSIDFSTKVECKEGKTIAVDRRMIWTGAGAPSQEGHSSIGVTAPAKTWYLPEGSSKWGFETWLLIQNPGTKDASVTITYMIEGEKPVEKTKTVTASSRASFNMETDIGAKDASIKVVSNVPVIPERAMYRNNRREGHCSIGTTTPANNYYLAEGTTDWGFTTYVLVQNPNSKAATINITYMTPTGAVPQAAFTMDANSRKTITVNSVPGMSKTDCSIHVSGSLPIIAERAMYWGAGTPLGEACHDSIGMDSPHTNFYLPDGEAQNGMETWTLIQNPNKTSVSVEVSYLTPDGKGNVVKKESIPASSRKSFSMAEHSGITGRASIMVTSKTAGKKIMVERAMYWNTRGAGTDTIGGYSD